MHTEESLMALVGGIIDLGDVPLEKEMAIRLAIREVMAERDEWEEAYLNQRQIIDDELRPRAEKADRNKRGEPVACATFREGQLVGVTCELLPDGDHNLYSALPVDPEKGERVRALVEQLNRSNDSDLQRWWRSSEARYFVPMCEEAAKLLREAYL
jgi:hypothetical protein